MRVMAECIPCYLKQVISACRVAGLDDDGQQTLLADLLPMIAGLDPAKTPAENSTLVLLAAYRQLGQDDPFKEAKAFSNRLARTFLPSLEKIVEFSEDPLLTVLKVAVAGNVIDMGINPRFDVNAGIRQVLDGGLARCDMEPLRALLQDCGNLVVIGDNSGEIVFDYLLLAQLRQYAAEIYYVVKGGPILNDATLEDAESAGINLLAKVVTTGSNYLGLIPEFCGEPLRSLLENAGLVLAKGQANYETMEGTALAENRAFFLLRAKCPCVASHLGVEFGESVLVGNQVEGGG